MHSRIIIWNILAVKKKQAWALGHGRLVLIQTHSAESRLAGNERKRTPSATRCLPWSGPPAGAHGALFLKVVALRTGGLAFWGCRSGREQCNVGLAREARFDRIKTPQRQVRRTNGSRRAAFRDSESQDLLRYGSRGRKGSRRRELPYHPGRDAGSRWRVRLGKIGDEPVDHAVGSARPVRRWPDSSAR